MMSSPVTRINIPVTHLMYLWMGKTGMCNYWDHDPGLISHGFTNIDKKRIKR